MRPPGYLPNSLEAVGIVWGATSVSVHRAPHLLGTWSTKVRRRARRLASAAPCKHLQLGGLKRIGLCNPVNGYQHQTFGCLHKDSKSWAWKSKFVPLGCSKPSAMLSSTGTSTQAVCKPAAWIQLKKSFYTQRHDELRIYTLDHWFWNHLIWSNTQNVVYACAMIYIVLYR